MTGRRRIEFARSRERLVALSAMAVAVLGLSLVSADTVSRAQGEAASGDDLVATAPAEGAASGAAPAAAAIDRSLARRSGSAFPAGVGAEDDARAPEPLRVAPDLGAQAHPDRRIRVFEDLPSYRDRRLRTPVSPYLVPQASGVFASSVQAVPEAVLARSTWRPECPVAPSDLRWVTVTHVGFDGLAHAGELLVHRRVADQFVEVFRELFEARYPIERMWITTMAELHEQDWSHGIDNNTGAFVCRNRVGSGSWSEHAHGLAVDVNPYHNPYVRGDLVVPAHARSYLHRDERPGIIHDGDVVVRSFAEMGWTWGGRWTSATDHMHFSHNDR